MNLHLRIERCYVRMLRARTGAWYEAWANAFYVYVMAHKSQRTVDEFLQLERDLGLV